MSFSLKQSRKHREARSKLVPPPEVTYVTALFSVLEDFRSTDEDLRTEFDTFGEARDHAINELGLWASELLALIDQLKLATCFEDLDLGWHEPLLTKSPEDQG